MKLLLEKTLANSVLLFRKIGYLAGRFGIVMFYILMVSAIGLSLIVLMPVYIIVSMCLSTLYQKNAK